MESNIQHGQTKQTLQQFAQHHRLKTRRDTSGEEIIAGHRKLMRKSQLPDRVEYCSHVLDGFEDHRLGVCLFYPTERCWNFARKQLVALGCMVRQDGDTEGVLTFDPASRTQTRAVLRAARIFPRRLSKEPSPGQLAARQAFATKRRSLTVETPAQDSTRYDQDGVFRPILSTQGVGLG